MKYFLFCENTTRVKPAAKQSDKTKKRCDASEEM